MQVLKTHIQTPERFGQHNQPAPTPNHNKSKAQQKNPIGETSEGKCRRRETERNAGKWIEETKKDKGVLQNNKKVKSEMKREEKKRD